MLGLGIGMMTGGAPSEWTPADLSSLIHWYKYDTGLTKSTVDGVANIVTNWADQKGSNHLIGFDADSGGTVDADEAPQWIDGGGLKFGDASDSLSFTSELQLGTFAIYGRYKWESGSTINAETLFEKTSGSSDFIKLQSSTTARVKVSGNRHDYNLPATVSLNTKFNFGFERQDTSATTDDKMLIFLNNEVATQSGTGDGTQAITDLLDVGRVGSPTHTSYVYEIVICNDALSVADRALLNTHFNNISGT